MSKDSRSLHVNLETIQNKIQETGNIVHLKKKLQEEEGTNLALREEISALKLAFLNKDLNPKSIDMTASIEEITGTTNFLKLFLSKLASVLSRSGAATTGLLRPP